MALLLLAPGEPERKTWTVEGVEREGLVCLPTKPPEGGAPVLFGFHGHGGSMRNAARSFRFHEHWPEAVVVYLQGLPTPGRLTDPEGKKPGWQHAEGEQGNRDLKLFDAVLSDLKTSGKIDEKRVFASGHSNGGGFSYLLAAARRSALAAIAPSAAAGGRLLKEPIPLLHVAGEKDPLVTFASQQRSLETVKALNGCGEVGKDWAPGCTLYASSKDAPLVAFIHAGDHKYPAEAPALIVKFLKDQARR